MFQKNQRSLLLEVLDMNMQNLYLSKTSKAIKKKDVKKNINKVLWNTNFPGISPRFQTLSKEFINLSKVAKRSLEESLNIFIMIASSRQASFQYMIEIIKKVNNLQLTIRTHPFESSDFYEKNILNQYKNIQISTVNDINDDLEKNSLVLQNGCQTTLDAFIRGIPSLRLNEDESNIWSKVSPFVESNELIQNISSPFFIQEILNKQKILFKNHRVSDYLFNLEKEFNFFETSLSSKKSLCNSNGFNLNLKVYIFYIKFLSYLKKFLKKLLRKNNKNYKLTSNQINEFLKEKFPNENWIFKEKCYLYPRDNLL